VFAKDNERNDGEEIGVAGMKFKIRLK